LYLCIFLRTIALVAAVGRAATAQNAVVSSVTVTESLVAATCRALETSIYDFRTNIYQRHVATTCHRDRSRLGNHTFNNCFSERMVQLWVQNTHITTYCKLWAQFTSVMVLFSLTSSNFELQTQNNQIG